MDDDNGALLQPRWTDKSGQRVTSVGGAGCGSGGGVWGNGFTSLRRVVFSFVTVSRASVVVFVCTCTVSSLVLSFLFSGFYVRLLQCVEFPLTHARSLRHTYLYVGGVGPPIYYRGYAVD